MVGVEEFTATGAAIGTAAYISPEQTQGEGVDHRTDIYAIGAMLFEMVSGTPPFDADSVMALMMKHINEPVPDLRQRIPSLSPKMIEIVEKALAKDPAQRYQNADEIDADLSAISIPASSPKDETLIEDTIFEKTTPDGTISDQPLPLPKPVSPTSPLPLPETDNEPTLRKNRGYPRRFIELLSAAIGGGTVVVLVLICLIAIAILILPRIFNL